MYRSNDNKAWKAARKAGLIVHKVQGIQGTRGSEKSSVFVVCVKDKDGTLSHFRQLFTAEQVIAEAQKAEHDTFSIGDFMGDIIEGHWQRINAEPRTVMVDVPCVSGNA